MIDKATIQAAADRLDQAMKRRSWCEPVRDLLGTDEIDAAYTVQELNIQRRLAAGERLVGAKIGLTSKAVQTQLGVDQPDFGMLTDAMQVENGGMVAWDVLAQPKAEAEIAFILGSDLNGVVDMDTLVASITHVVASIEIVGSRIADWNIRITDTVADNASASHFVLSDARVPLTGTDLEHCAMKLYRNGALASEGAGRACLGNPLNAALWLAQTMQRLGNPLRAGDIVLAGALGPMVPVQPGDAFHATIEGIGEVSVHFES